MTKPQHEMYAHYTKMAWIIYTLVVAIFITILILFVAEDTEERFFFVLMPAAAYVFRPMREPFSKLIFKFTGVSPPAKED